MPSPSVEIRGMSELIARMRAFPGKLDAVLRDGVQATLLILWEKTPPYPAPPDGSKYVRTGTLGRTLGSDFGGGRSSGQPEIFGVKRIGQGSFEGRFGTNLEYAEYVIGDGTQAAQHQGRWWTLSSIAERAKDKIGDLWNGIAHKLAAFLDRGQV